MFSTRKILVKIVSTLPLFSSLEPIQPTIPLYTACWNDYSRDVEQMVNCFAEHMPAPRFGIGHSMGGQCIFECAIRNPSLFIAIVGLDPIIQNVQWDGYMPGSHPIVASSRRRDIWKSREEAEQYFRTRPYYKTWDPRVVDAQIVGSYSNDT